ncbi:MAG: ShlB/FhaC/HecB family hemolysin secretion/activation protein [Crocosphaera sp.]
MNKNMLNSYQTFLSIFSLVLTIFPYRLVHSQPSPLTLEIPQRISQQEDIDELPINDRIFVTELKLTGDYTAFTPEEIKDIKVLDPPQPIASIKEKFLTLTQLLQIASVIADFYQQRGYQTSGAIVIIPEKTQQEKKGIVNLKIIEGKLENITISLENKPEKFGKLGQYIHARLAVNLEKPLNINHLLEAIQLLQLDPLIERISAQLSKGKEPAKNRLTVTYIPAATSRISPILDNGRSPSVGSIQTGVELSQANLWGWGEQVNFNYINTDGSDRYGVSYQVPLTNQNTTLKLDYIHSDNAVVEYPFDDIDRDGNKRDITSVYDSYELTLTHPLIRSIEAETFTELAMEINASWRRTQSFLFNEPFPFSLSADVAGNTKIFALRWQTNFTQQSPEQIIAIRSQVSLGLETLGATIAPTLPGVEPIPDSGFLAWRVQGQYVKTLGKDSLWLVRSNWQLSADPLVPIEQFGVGGLGSVRGYRQDYLLTDNGFFLTTEIRVPVLRAFKNQGVLQIVPFLDYGMGWDNETNAIDHNNLASMGLGLVGRFNNFQLRFDWGYPLIKVENRDRTWQENGLYFTLSYDLSW